MQNQPSPQGFVASCHQCAAQAEQCRVEDHRWEDVSKTESQGAQQRTQDCGLYGVEIAHEQAPEDELFEEGAEKHLGRKREEYAQAVLEWRI